MFAKPACRRVTAPKVYFWTSSKAPRSGRVLCPVNSDIWVFASIQNLPTGNIAQHNAVGRIPNLASLDPFKEIRRPFARNRPRRPIVPVSQMPVPTVRKVERARQRNGFVLERIFPNNLARSFVLSWAGFASASAPESPSATSSHCRRIGRHSCLANSRP